MSKQKGIYVGLEIDDFCCDRFKWYIFDIDEDGVVYSECGNPNCKNPGVYLPELGDLDRLRTKLTMLGPEVYPL